MKQEGNDHFRAKRWDEALVAYRSALGHLPSRPRSNDLGNDESDGPHRDDVPDGESTELEPEPEVPPPQQLPPSELEVECAKARAVLNANIAACHMKLVSVYCYTIQLHNLHAPSDTG